MIQDIVHCIKSIIIDLVVLSKEKIHFHLVDKVILLPDVQHAGAGDYSVKMRRHKEDMTNQLTIILIVRL